MRKVLGLAVGAAMMAAAPVQAAEWYAVTAAPDGPIVFVEKGSIRNEDGIVKAWHQFVQKAPINGTRSITTLSYVNCETQVYATSYIARYDDNGRVISTSNFDPLQWSPVIPGSINEALTQVTCSPPETWEDKNLAYKVMKSPVEFAKAYFASE